MKTKIFLRNIFKLNFFVLIVVLFSFSSCNIIQPNGYYFVSDTISTQNDNPIEEFEKKALIIYFTGIRCPNCPDAHAELYQIQSVNPKKVLAIGIHGTSFAAPMPSQGFLTDLRTDVGNEIVATFDVTQIPIGLVNNYEKTGLTMHSGWADAVDNELNLEPTIGISIQNNFNTFNNNLEVSLKITSLAQLENSLKLCVFILEDNIITKQKYGITSIDDYVQKNVFRRTLSNVWGDNIFEEGADENHEEIINFSCSIPQEWKSKDCKIIAFIYDENFRILNVQQEFIE